MQRPTRRLAGALALSVLTAAGLGACGSDDDTETATTTTAGPQGSPVVSIDMTDYAYTVSGPLTAGGSLKISNTGKEIHMMGIGRFKPGKTLADLQRALSEAGPPGGEGGATTTTAAGGTPTTGRGRGTATTVAGATTTTAAGATTTTAAGGSDEAAGGAGRDDPTAEIMDDIGLPGNVMSPGQSAEIMVPNLTPGTYGLICYIPTEGDGMPHFAMGMVNQLEVVAGTAPPTPTADATYKLAAGQAVQGPASLTPGKHTLRFDAAVGSEELEPTLELLNPGVTPVEFDETLNQLFESEAPPPGAANQVPGQLVFGGTDLNSVTTFYLTVDLKPGNYYIVAGDRDADATEPPKEVLNVKVA